MLRARAASHGLSVPLSQQDLSSVSSSPTSSPKTKVAALALPKPSQVGPTQLQRRQVPRPDAVLTHKQAQGNSLQLPHPSSRRIFCFFLCLDPCRFLFSEFCVESQHLRGSFPCSSAHHSLEGLELGWKQHFCSLWSLPSVGSGKGFLSG